MSGETNGNNLDGTNYNGEPEIDLENAFSDLIAEFFEEGNGNDVGDNVKINSGVTENATVGTTNNILYTNLETVQNGKDIEYVEENTGNIGGDNNVTGENVTTNNIYNKLGDITPETTIHNSYGVVTFNESLKNIVNENNVIEDANGIGDVVNAGNGINGGIGDNKDFKLTQGNLPAKIGFWTKLRNFFIPESKLQYSVQENGNTNTGIWNKVQNFFSFGKEK